MADSARGDGLPEEERLQPAEANGAAEEVSEGSEDEWSYRNKLILAPMVRVNSLAFRSLCAENGADMLYSEEIVARSMLNSVRTENAALGTVDFHRRDQPGHVIFRVRPRERVVLQLGTACGVEALQAAEKAAADVRAIDLNMGCPVKFSVQGGMGSALLTEPEKVRDILTTLRRNLPASLPITAKIRLLDDYKESLALAQMIESCGVAALAVHARRRHDRPRHWAQWDQFRLLRESLPTSLPLILNGDVFTPAEVRRAYEETKADSLMLARGALWNPSIFRVAGGITANGLARPTLPMLTQADVVSRFVELTDATSCPISNAKYTAMLMLEGAGRTPPFALFQRAKTIAELRVAAAALHDHAHFTQPGGDFCPAILEPPPDLPDALSLPINAWRPVPAFYQASETKPSARSKAAKARATLSAEAAAHNAKAVAAAKASADVPADEALPASPYAVDATREDRYGPRPADSTSAHKRTIDQV